MNIQQTKTFFALVFTLFLASSAQASQPLTSISAIATGGNHTCALTSAGGVWCWGADSSGQLGINSPTWSVHTPVAVSGLGSGVTAIAAGGAHTCALTTAGGVQCWGYDWDGQLGDNRTRDVYFERLTPVAVSGMDSGVTAIAAGASHTCALTSGGAVLCWGDDAAGQLGDNSTGVYLFNDRLTPVAVSGLDSGVTAIAAGVSHTCALTSAGGVWCWGYDYFGELGDDSTGDVNYDRLTPVAVSGLGSGVTAIAAGDFHTCALTNSGAVQCWGNDILGELGDNSTGDVNHHRLTPVAVSGLSGVTAITAGSHHTCALTDIGGVWCWGYDGDGEIGDNSTGDANNERLTPVAVSGLGSGVATIVAGSDYTCALTSAGVVKCWGDASNGQLGDSSRGDVNNVRLMPVNVLASAPTRTHDFDGDAISDVLFLNTTTGGTQYWKAATKSQAVYPGAYDTSYTYAGSGDFNGDAKADIFFTKSSNNGTLYWSGAVKTAATYPGTSAAGFSVAAICDTNGDG